MKKMTLSKYQQLVEEQSRALLDAVVAAGEGNLEGEIEVPQGIEPLSALALQLRALIQAQAELKAQVGEQRRKLEAARAEVQAVQRRYLHQEWARYVADGASGWGYCLSNDADEPTAEAWLPVMTTAVEEARIVIKSNGTNESMMGLPIRLHGELIGVLGFTRQGEADWPEEELAMVENIVEQVGLVLETQRLSRQTQRVLAAGDRLAERLNSLNEMSQALSRAENVDDVFKAVAQHITQLLPADRVSIVLLNATSGLFTSLILTGEEGFVSSGDQKPLAGTLVEIAIRENKVMVTQDTQASPWRGMKDQAARGVLATMTAPLVINGRAAGALNVGSKEPNVYTPQDQSILFQVASLLAAAVENKRQTQEAGLLLNKRVRELDVLIDVGRKAEEIPSIPEYLEWVAGRIAPAMQYPELCVAAIELDGQIYGAAEVPGLSCQLTQGLRIGGDLAGRIYIAYREDRDFLDEESALLEGINRRVSAFIQNQRLLAQAQMSLAEIEALYGISASLNATTTLQEVLQVVVSASVAGGAANADLFTIEVDAAGRPEWLEVVATWQDQERTALPLGTRLYLLDYPGGTLWADMPDEPIMLGDVMADKRLDSAARVIYQQFGTRAAVTFPMLVGGSWIGGITINWSSPQEFTEEDRRLYKALAVQAAVLVNNRLLFDQAQEALANVEAIQRRYTVQAWEAYRARRITMKYEEVREGVDPRGDDLPPEVTTAVSTRKAVVTAGPSDVENGAEVTGNGGPLPDAAISSLIVPLTVRDEVIAVLGLEETNKARRWSPEEIALVQAVVEQMAEAAENLRLLDETQQRAAREKQVNEIGEKIQAAQSLEEALQIAVREVGLSLQAPQTTVQLTVEAENVK